MERTAVRVTLFFVALVLALGRAHAEPRPAALADNIATLETQAKALWLRRDEPASARAALAAFERLAALRPDNAAVQIYLARACWWYAVLRPQAPRNERRALLLRGVGAARRAEDISPRDPGGYYWEAANLSEDEWVDGGFVSPADLLRLRSLIQTVDSINPWYHHGSIRYIEAEIILNVPTPERWLTGRSLRAAVTSTLRALGFENRCFYGHWILARALATSGRRGAAIAQLDYILQASPEAFLPDAPENRAVKRWATALREKLTEIR